MRRNIGLRILLPLVVIVMLLAIFWNWDWFLPAVDAQASAALGRKVTVQHLHVGLGASTMVTATGVTIANPENFPAGEPPLATADRLAMKVDLMGYIMHRTLAVTAIEVDHPVVNIRQLPDGTNNYTLKSRFSSASASPPLKLGNLVINGGTASIVLPVQKAYFNLAIQTRNARPGTRLFTRGETVVDIRGTYADAPITGALIGGALLSLRNGSTPYPVDLHLQNGQTRAYLTGTIKDPVNFAGAHLHLAVSGQNMADLDQLTGIPIPSTPAFSLSGNLDYSGHTLRFKNVSGRIGSSDVEGTIIEAPGAPRLVTANLTSRRVDLTDLAGFLEHDDFKTNRPKAGTANASINLLPATPLNLPKIDMANLDLRYRGKQIINRDVPLDDLTVHLIIHNGHITANPLNFAVGTGAIASNFDLNPVNGVLHIKASIDVRKLPLSRLMGATPAFAGDGTVGGSAYVTGTGNSVAAILGGGDGHASLFLQNGADVSRLMVDLAGLRTGNAVLSALNIPAKAKIHCLISDFSLTGGVAGTKTFLRTNEEANILGAGKIDLSTETLNLALWREAAHSSIGSLSTPVTIGGTLKNPSMSLAPGPLGQAAEPATALGVLFPPLAILPTIRLGLGDKNACVDTISALDAGHPHNPK